MKYSDNMVAEMREIGSFDYNSAKAFVEAHEGLTLRSVIAKCNALGLEYQAKDPKQRARKAAGRAKQDVVKSIEAAVGSTLASLSKMTVSDLEVLEKAVA